MPRGSAGGNYLARERGAFEPTPQPKVEKPIAANSVSKESLPTGPISIREQEKRIAEAFARI